MDLKEYQIKLREKFFARLERKTGWGKEEVKKEFIKATTEALMEMLAIEHL